MAPYSGQSKDRRFLNDIKVRVFFRKKHKKSTCAVIIRIITFTNQIFP